ncbi:Ribbon-helix-helix protein, copG family [Xaviernesmea oryzae]|uniref:Ribbon-helix-helix protein, copG family n=1 Tax=Xaviernesmea oryzae TaxID=464029 RepID=A0A1X7F8E0_9HYPH|nr:CopG family transcriptional regulator [Xaviernesmea oryzae]SMF47457.1 Ribbon-helix-helix protein, copG family [Xaviernesmea oryzae]
MQTVVELNDAEIEALDRLAQKENVPRSALIEQAVRVFLQKRKKQKQADAFGLWGDRVVDGLAFQEKVRNEW